MASVTNVYITNVDDMTVDHSQWLAEYSSSTNPTGKGYLRISSRTTNSIEILFIVNSKSNGSGYKNIGVTYVHGSIPSNNELLAIDFTRTGNLGYTGSQGTTGYTGSSGGGTPGGSNTYVQFNNSGAFGGSADLTWNDSSKILDIGGTTGSIRLPSTETSTPSLPSGDDIALFGRKIAGRKLPAFVGPSGLDSALQPFLARNKIGYWNPPGNATTVPGVFGFAAIGTVGTATARNVATTNVLTRMRRLAYVSAATAGSLASVRVAVAQYTTGTGSGLGGFTWVARFGVSDAATVSGARMFVGMSSNDAAATNVEPNTLTNSIGMAQLSTDATQWYLVYGGSAAQTAIALGTGLGAPTTTTTAWEMALFSSPNDNAVVYYQVTNLGTGAVASGTLSGTPGTTTPANTTLLTTQMWRCNNATALAVGMDICSIYVESDY
jgi:hypothetical protein